MPARVEQKEKELRRKKNAIEIPEMPD